VIKRFLVLALAIAALTYSTPVQASAPTPPPGSHMGPVGVIVRVKNLSHTCVWVSVAYASFYTPWAWMKDPHNTARFVHPNGFYDFATVTANVLPVPVPVEMKVEGTFMANADCSGAHAREITVINKSILPQEDHGFSAKATSVLTGIDAASYSVGPIQPGIH
jgi:hypothetical protein